jgi:hypothetical protein
MHSSVGRRSRRALLAAALLLPLATLVPLPASPPESRASPTETAAPAPAPAADTGSRASTRPEAPPPRAPLDGTGALPPDTARAADPPSKNALAPPDGAGTLPPGPGALVVAPGASPVETFTIPHEHAPPESPAAPTSMTAPTAPAGVSPSAGPTVAKIGFYVYEFKEVNTKEQSYLADFYLWMRFSTPDDEFAKVYEGIDIMNGKVESREEVDRIREGDSRYVCWRYLVSFYLHFDLRHYPFDVQRFDIVVEPHWYDVSQQVFEDDVESYANSRMTPPHVWGVRPGGVESGEFNLVRVERRATRSLYDTDFGNLAAGNQLLPYSRFTFSMVFARDFKPYFFKIIVPLLIIISTAYLIFFVPPRLLDVSSALGLTAVLTTMAFNVSVTQNLPEIGYLVTSDKFFIATYFLLFLTLVQAVIAFRFEDRGERERADRWYERCRRVFPILYLGAFAILLADALSV